MNNKCIHSEANPHTKLCLICGHDVTIDDTIATKEEARQYAKESFIVTSLSREDMESIGFNTSTLSDADMQAIAEKLGESYVERDFWQDLESIAKYGYKLKQKEV